MCWGMRRGLHGSPSPNSSRCNFCLRLHFGKTPLWDSEEGRNPLSAGTQPPQRCPPSSEASPQGTCCSPPAPQPPARQHGSRGTGCPHVTRRCTRDRPRPPRVAQRPDSPLLAAPSQPAERQRWEPLERRELRPRRGAVSFLTVKLGAWKFSLRRRPDLAMRAGAVGS